MAGLAHDGEKVQRQRAESEKVQRAESESREKRVRAERREVKWVEALACFGFGKLFTEKFSVFYIPIFWSKEKIFH